MKAVSTEGGMDWKVGDWCFFEFKVGHVARVTENGGYSVGNGTTEVSGMLADRMFPLDYTIMQISTSFEWDNWSLHRESEGFNLNWPDIHRWFVDKWAEACRAKNDGVAVERILNEKQKFVREIRDGMRDMRLRTVGGIQAFARR
jgi:hypothetical protein